MERSDWQENLTHGFFFEHKITHSHAHFNIIEKLDFIDEYEEWQLLQGHYCLNLGTRGDTLNSLAI